MHIAFEVPVFVLTVIFPFEVQCMSSKLVPRNHIHLYGLLYWPAANEHKD
jgi:hypothetical protein